MSSLKKLVSLINRANKKRGYKQITFATGRIKRMRKGESKCNGILRRIHGTSIVIPRNNPDMYEIMMMTQLTRWNRH